MSGTPSGERTAASIASQRRRTVDVIVPCYNYGHFLPGCLASVLSQEDVDVRVLLIDDCSSDDSAEVASRLAEQDARITVRRHGDNVGLIGTANEGLEWLESDFVVLLSADDLLAPGSLARAVQVMDDHPNVGLVYGRALLAREGHAIPTPAGRWRATKVWSGRDWIEGRCREARNCIFSPEAVVRTSVQRAVGSYDPACYHNSDLNMWLRVAARSDVAHIRGVPQAIYRVHSDSMVHRDMTPMIDMRERRAAFDAFFATSRPHLSRPTELQTQAARSLASHALSQANWELARGGDAGVVEDLTAFALEVFPQARSLAQWRSLRTRKRLGARYARVLLPYAVTRTLRRVRGRIRWQRTMWRGV